MNITKPVYKHDCEECIFLGNLSYSGRWVPQGVISVDLYYHHGTIPTFIARYGDDGPEYFSGFQIDWVLRDDMRDYPLLEAFKRAVKKEIVTFRLDKGYEYNWIVQFQKEDGYLWAD